MPRLRVRLACLLRVAKRQVCVLTPPSRYSCTSVSIDRPEQSLNPPGGKLSNRTVKRNAGAGSFRASAIDRSAFLEDFHGVLGLADYDDDEFGWIRRLYADLTHDASKVDFLGRSGRVVALDRVRLG